MTLGNFDLDKWLKDNKISCKDEEKLKDYIKKIVENCPIYISVENILSDNRYDIDLTAKFINEFGDLVSSNGCLGYTSHDYIVVQFNDMDRLLCKLDNNLVRIQCKKSHNFKVDTLIKNMIIANRSLVVSWIKELNNSKIKVSEVQSEESCQ